MKSVRDEWYSETSGAGDASTSRPLTDTDWTGADMRTVANESPAAQHDRCPNCNLPGWITGRGTYTAVCGSQWDDLDGVTYAAPPCPVIEAKNDAIEALEFELAELRSEVAA